MAPILRRLTGGAPASRPARRVLDEITLELGGRPVQIRRWRDARCRRMRLVVDDRGPRLSMPLRASQAAGEAFVREHADWLLTQLDKLGRGMPMDGPALAIGRTTHLPLLDQELEVAWIAHRHTHVVLEDGRLLFHYSPRAGQAALARALGDFYLAQIRAQVGPEVARWLPELPRAPRRFIYKQMSSMWGSLAPDDTIRLDISLVLAPPAALRYVLIHELCHLIQPNHSPAFWAEVEKRMRFWHAQRLFLSVAGRGIKHRMRRLLAVD